MLFGFDQRRKTDENLRALINQLRKFDLDYAELRLRTTKIWFRLRRKDIQTSAQLVNRKLQEYNKTQYGKRYKKITRYQVGDLALVRKLQHKPSTDTKLLPKFKGPYQVKAILNKNHFVITDVPGYNLSQNRTILSKASQKCGRYIY